MHMGCEMHLLLAACLPRLREARCTKSTLKTPVFSTQHKLEYSDDSSFFLGGWMDVSRRTPIAELLRLDVDSVYVRRRLWRTC